MAVAKSSPFQALAQQRFNKAMELEKRLWNLLQTKCPLDSHVRDLRNSIRDCYVLIVLEDHGFAESHDVEQALWRLHYKQIEEFRARTRKSASAGESTPQIPMPGAKPVYGTKATLSRREPLQKVLGVFKNFLSEATGFYHELIVKLRSKCGLPRGYVLYEDSMAVCDETKSAEVAKFQLSCHRCLIFLGDLARYKEYHCEGDARSHDWSVAANYYFKAISVYPSGGNPHNQLAVLATYESDDLLAVYRYFRSLAVDNPFLTARDNLILLFEKNRQQYAHLSAHTNETSIPVSGSETMKVVEKVKTGDRMILLGNGAFKLAVKEHSELSAETKRLPSFVSELQRDFQVRFIRLNGILFTRTSLETFPDVYSAALNDWEHLLTTGDSALEAGLGLEHRGGIGIGKSGAASVVQLIAILIFTVHNVSNAYQSSYLDALQHSTLLRYAFTAAFEFVAWIMHCCVVMKDVSQSPLLPAMLVFMEWLACRPEMALGVGGDADEKQGVSSSFWKQCVSLLNRLPNFDNGNDLDGSLEVSVEMDSMNNFREPECGFALWEDHELQGFVPLAPAQLTLDYAKRVHFLPGDKREQQMRIKRLIAAAKAVSNALEGTGKCISFDEDTCKFVLPSDLTRKVNRICADNVNWSSALACGSVSEDSTGSKLSINIRKEISDFSISKEQIKQSLPEILSVNQTVGDDEEEVIVFQPLLRESSLCSSASLETQIEIPVCSFGLLKSSSTGNDHGLDVLKQYVQSASGSGQFMNSNPVYTNTEFENGIVDCFQTPSMQHISSSLNGVSHLVSEVPSLSGTSCKYLDVGLNDLNNVNFTSMNSLHNGSTGQVSAQHWLNYTKSADSAHSSADAPHGNRVLQSNSGMFIDGLPKFPGVIGQAKVANTNDLIRDTALSSHLNNLPNTTLSGTLGTHIYSWNPVTHIPVTSSVYVNGLPEIPASSCLNPHGDVMCNLVSSMPMVVIPGTTVLSSGREKPVNGHSKAVISREGNILNAEERCSSFVPVSSIGISSIWVSKENPTSSWLNPVTQPPPGFAPSSRKSSIKATEPPPRNQCEVENQNMIDMEEQLIDDYSWLDDFTPLKSESCSRSRWEDAVTVYDCGIKSCFSTGLEFGGFPFPGMGPSQYQNVAKQQKQNLAFQQQLLLQQNKNGGLGLDQQPYLYGMRHLSDGQDQAYAGQLLLHHQQ